MECSSERAQLVGLLNDTRTILGRLDMANTIEELDRALVDFLETTNAIASARFRTDALEERRMDLAATLTDMVRLYGEAAQGNGSDEGRRQLLDAVETVSSLYLSVRDLECHSTGG